MVIAIPEKIQTGGLRIHFLENPQAFFLFLLYPWKFQAKQSSTLDIPQNSVWSLWKFQDQKQRPLEIPHYFFLGHPWKLHMLFHPWRFHILNPPVWIFSGIAQ